MESAADRIVVGYDASPESKEAVQWAATVAERRSAPLLVVTATGADDTGPSAGDPELREAAAYETAKEGVELARRTATVEAEAIGAHQDPATVLTGYSDDAQLIVVGHRGSGRLRSRFLGSVAFTVTTHANCPVVVVRESLEPLRTTEHHSVVGIDGSKPSNVALHHAARWASETGSLLRIVVAWNPKKMWAQAWSVPDHGRPATPVPGGSSLINDYGQTTAQSSGTDGTDPQLRAKEIAQDAVEEVLNRHPELKVETVVASGRPSDVIVDASDNASIIVVGARGRGNFANLLLGSVSREVVEQAKSAVYVVR